MSSVLDVQTQPAGDWRRRLTLRPVTPADYDGILASDREVYPSPNGLTLEALQTWYANYPEFGMVFADAETGAIAGSCVVVPLSKHGWEQLTQGHLSEAALGADTLFDANRDNEIGLHVYHIEKTLAYPADLPRFGLVALEALADVLQAIQQRLQQAARQGSKGDPLVQAASRSPAAEGPTGSADVGSAPATQARLRVCGLSGLAVTRAGFALFSLLYGCRERSYVCPEHILRRTCDGRLEVHSVELQQQLIQLLAAAGRKEAAAGGGEAGRGGLSYVMRARMLVVTPEEPSLVWCFLGAEGQCARAGDVRVS